MIKNYNQFINEDIRSKTIIVPKEFTIDNLKREYPDLNINVTDFNVVISSDRVLYLKKVFYGALKKDHINKDDIIFENCKEIKLHTINGFTKISDYGVFGENIKIFDCTHCTNLTSLEGSPKEVSIWFSCSHCDNLTSLDGAPKEVGDKFYCSWNPNLVSLDGSPTTIGGDFICYDNNPNFIELAIEKYGSKVVPI